MNQATKWAWEVRLGIVAPILTVGGVLVGVWQFLEGQERSTRLEYELLARESAIEFQRQLWLEQLDTYRRVADIAGSIAARHDQTERLEELTREFLEVYWGVMMFVADDQVEVAMIEFYQEVRDYRSGWGSADLLKVKANRLVEACRASTERRWKEIGDAS